MRIRNCDPETGTFISKDPIGLNGGVNMYGYCGNNPVNLVDPMGMAGGYLPRSIGDIGENMLTAILGGGTKRAFNTSDGWRFVDFVTQYSTDQEIANESKVGYQTLTAAIQRHILKDAELLGDTAIPYETCMKPLISLSVLALPCQKTSSSHPTYLQILKILRKTAHFA